MKDFPEYCLSLIRLFYLVRISDGCVETGLLLGLGLGIILSLGFSVNLGLGFGLGIGLGREKIVWPHIFSSGLKT